MSREILERFGGSRVLEECWNEKWFKNRKTLEKWGPQGIPAGIFVGGASQEAGRGQAEALELEFRRFSCSTLRTPEEGGRFKGSAQPADPK